jgi:hypothetical protein
MRNILAAATLVLGLVAALPARADIYRWVDAEGGVHYSDRWQPGATLVQVTHKGSNDAAIAAKLMEQQKVAAEGDRVSAQLSQEQQAAVVRQETQKAQGEVCKQAKDRYQKAIATRRLYVEDKPGERRLLNDAEAEQARIEARQEMQDACGLASTAPPPRQ